MPDRAPATTRDPAAHFWDPAKHPHGEHGHWATTTGAGDTALDTAARAASDHLAAADAALEQAGPTGAAGRRHLRKAVAFLVTSAANAVADLMAATSAAGDLNAAIEKRYGPKASRAITAAVKATSHMVGVHQMPPTSVIPGTTFLKKLPFLVVAEVVRLVRHRPDEKPKEKVRTKAHGKRIEHAVRKKANAILKKRVKSEIGKGAVPAKKVKMPAHFAGPASGAAWDAFAAEVLARVQAAFAAWVQARSRQLAESLRPLSGAAFAAERWVTVESDKGTARIAIAGDGTITKGPKGLVGRPATEALRPSKRERIKAKSEKRATKKAAGTAGKNARRTAPVVDPIASAKVAAAASSVLSRGRTAIKRAIKHLDKKTDVVGVKHVKRLFKGANKLVAKATKKIAKRYGKSEAVAILGCGALVGTNPFITPTWLLALPGSTLLGALPFLAVAETVHQGRRAARSLRAAVGFVAGADEAVAPPKAAVAAARSLWREYLAWLRPQAETLARTLAGLADAALPPVVARPEESAAFAAWEAAESDHSRAEFAEFAESVRLSVAALSADLSAGRVALREWRGRTAALLAPVPFRAAVAASPSGVSPAGWDLAERQARAVIAHVALFAERLDACEEDWTRAAPQRADLYAQAGFSDFQEHRRLTARAGGLDAECRFCAPECRECPECRDQAAAGWQEAGTLSAAGDCACATRCRCEFGFGAGAPDRRAAG